MLTHLLYLFGRGSIGLLHGMQTTRTVLGVMHYVILLLFLAKSNITHYFHEPVICNVIATLQKVAQYFCNVLLSSALLL